MHIIYSEKIKEQKGSKKRLREVKKRIAAFDRCIYTVQPKAYIEYQNTYAKMVGVNLQELSRKGLDAAIKQSFIDLEKLSDMKLVKKYKSLASNVYKIRPMYIGKRDDVINYKYVNQALLDIINSDF